MKKVIGLYLEEEDIKKLDRIVKARSLKGYSSLIKEFIDGSDWDWIRQREKNLEDKNA